MEDDLGIGRGWVGCGKWVEGGKRVDDGYRDVEDGWHVLVNVCHEQWLH